MKMIRSRPYNSKAQRKVQQSHKELHKKIYYDMVNLKHKGVNWVENLPNYVRVLNKSARQEVGRCSLLKCTMGKSQIL